MQIEFIQLYELDEAAERQRLANCFKGRELKLLTSILDNFVARDWAKVYEQLRGMKREQLEYLHPVIYEVIRKLADREKLKEDFKPRDFARISAAAKGMGGTNGGLVSPAGLEYPKFRVIGMEPAPAGRIEPSTREEFVLVFDDGAFHFKEGSGHPTRELSEAARYPCVEDAQEAAKDLVDLGAIARYPSLEVVHSFKVTAKSPARKKAAAKSAPAKAGAAKRRAAR